MAGDNDTAAQGRSPLSEITYPAVGADTMRLVAALMDDPNPIHFDAVSARKAGLGDRMVVQGPVTFGHMLVFAAKAMGGMNGIGHASIRFLGNVFEGERLTCGGSIGVPDESGNNLTVECEARVGDQIVARMRVTSGSCA